MKKIGVVVAMEREAAPLFSALGVGDFSKNHSDGCGKCGDVAYFDGDKSGAFRIEAFGKEILIIISGVGEILAAAATQKLIDLGAEAIVNFGVAGSLGGGDVKHTYLVSGVFHYEFDTSALDHSPVGKYSFVPSAIIPTDEKLNKIAHSAANLKEAICASGNKFVEDGAEKKNLRSMCGATVCEMEAAGVALTAFYHGVPCLILKTVSDGEGGADEYERTVDEAASVAAEVVKSILSSL